MSFYRSALEQKVLDTLRSIVVPTTGQTLLEAGMVKSLSTDNRRVFFLLDGANETISVVEDLTEEARSKLEAMIEIDSVSILSTRHTDAPQEQDTAAIFPSKASKPPRLPGVGHILAIGSGKGGVGKSTVSSNLAINLSLLGYRVGLLDADIYGPSQPRMMNLSGRPVARGQNLVPLSSYGIKVMSVGFLLPEKDALIWRGPILIKTINQLLHQVEWAPLDVLVIDLPPGTGDVQLSLSQETRIDGALIVSTPQDIALADARRAINMFQQMDIPIFGLIENMATHICSSCGHEESIFGLHGVREEAKNAQLPLLGSLPLSRQICRSSDNGAPISLEQPDSDIAQRYKDISRKVMAVMLSDT